MKSTAVPLLAAACAVLLLLPAWTAPSLATADGPSHLYNAMVAVDLMQDEPTYGAWLEHGSALAPNRAANTVLTWLAPAIGASRAETLLFSFTLLGTFLLLTTIASGRTRLSAAAVLMCAWIAQHWFAWTGFFDFSLSAIGFAALLLLLQHPAGLRRDLLIQVAALFLAWTHLFTFAIGVAVTAWILLLRALHERRPLVVLPAVPPAFLLIWLLAAGGTGGGGFGWGHKGKALAALLIGDFVVTFHPVDLLAGTIIMVTFWIALLHYLRSARPLRIGMPLAVPVFAAGLILLSVIGPDAIGEGSYISARLRFLAVVSLLPFMSERLALLAPAKRRALNVTLLTALVVHAGSASLRARAVAHDAAAIDALVASAGARPGDAIQMSLSDHERGAFRISAYAHLHARTAMRRRLVLLDNYEARLGIFPTRWRQEPETLQLERRGGVIGLRRRAGASWERPIHLVHEAGVRVEALHPAVVFHHTVDGVEFAVTTVTLDARR